MYQKDKDSRRESVLVRREDNKEQKKRGRRMDMSGGWEKKNVAVVGHGYLVDVIGEVEDSDTVSGQYGKKMAARDRNKCRERCLWFCQ